VGIFIAMIVLNLVKPKAAATHELLLNKAKLRVMSRKNFKFLSLISET
jgi:hypothetical protein